MKDESLWSFSQIGCYMKGNNIWRPEVCGLNLPIEQEEQDESRQVGLWDVRLLLETDEDKHHDRGRDSVVQLTRWQHKLLAKTFVFYVKKWQYISNAPVDNNHRVSAHFRSRCY